MTPGFSLDYGAALRVLVGHAVGVRTGGALTAVVTTAVHAVQPCVGRLSVLAGVGAVARVAIDFGAGVRVAG